MEFACLLLNSMIIVLLESQYIRFSLTFYILSMVKFSSPILLWTFISKMSLILIKACLNHKFHSLMLTRRNHSDGCVPLLRSMSTGMIIMSIRTNLIGDSKAGMIGSPDPSGQKLGLSLQEKISLFIAPILTLFTILLPLQWEILQLNLLLRVDSGSKTISTLSTTCWEPRKSELKV